MTEAAPSVGGRPGRLRHLHLSTPDERLAPRYDVVVVGGGIGGLSCGAFLANAGARVLVVERHARPGGLCSYFQRKGPFYFDAGAHFFGSVGNPRAFGGLMLRALALPTEFIALDPVELVHFPGESFALPANIEDHIALLARRFPHEAAPLRRFFDALFALYLHLRRGHKDSELIRRHAGTRYLDFLDAHFADPYLKSLLCTTYGFIGSALERLSLLAMTAMMMSYFYDGGFVARGGSQALADGLLLRLIDRGGALRLNDGVRTISVAGGRATGVVLESGRSIAADVVVSNADALATFRELIGAEHVDPSYLAELAGRRASNSCFVLYLGLRTTAERIRGARGWHWTSRDLRQPGNAPFYIATPSVLDPELCPPGCQILTATTLAEDAGTSAEAFSDRQRWAERKEERRRAARARLEQILPGLAEAIVVEEAASPRTIHRYTANSGGCMYGWESSVEQTWPRRLPIETPFPNLLLCGHWSATGPGVLSVVANAFRAAQLVERLRAAGGRAA